MYVDRLLGVLPQSNVRKANQAFTRLAALSPQYVVPGHERVTNMAQAQRESGDYYQFLIANIGAAARNLDPMSETLDTFASPTQFKRLQNFEALHQRKHGPGICEFRSTVGAFVRLCGHWDPPAVTY